MPCASATGRVGDAARRGCSGPSASAGSSRSACSPALVGQLHGVRQGRRWSARRSRCAAPRRACSPRSRTPSRAPGRSGRRAWSARESSKQPPWSIEMSTSTEPGFIRETSSLVTSVGALAPGHQHRADHQVGVEHGPLDLVRVGRDRSAGGPGRSGRPARSRSMLRVEQQHLGLHAERDRGGVHARTRRRRCTTTLAAYTPETPPISTPRPPCGPHQVVRADLRRQPAGDLGHRRQQRQRRRRAAPRSRRRCR